MAAYTFTVTADTTVVDLTDPAVNPKAAAMSTPRQGGFTLRNRFDCSDGWSPATFAASDIAAIKSTNAAAVTMTPFFILDVPARTMVRDVGFYAVAEQTAPEHSFTHSSAAASMSANDLKSADLAVYAVAWKKDNGTSVATYVELADMDLTAVGASTKGGSITGSYMAGLSSSASSNKISTPTNAGMIMQHTMASMAPAATSFPKPAYFPHGGRIALMIANGLDTSISDSTSGGDTKLKGFAGALAGQWEVQANCNYIPE